jgi:hypothetical protein
MQSVLTTSYAKKESLFKCALNNTLSIQEARYLRATKWYSALGVYILITLDNCPILPISSFSVKLHFPVCPLFRIIILFNMNYSILIW